MTPLNVLQSSLSLDALQQILTIEVYSGTHSVAVGFCKERMTVEAVLDVTLISSFCHFLNLP